MSHLVHLSKVALWLCAMFFVLVSLHGFGHRRPIAPTRPDHSEFLYEERKALDSLSRGAIAGAAPTIQPFEGAGCSGENLQLFEEPASCPNERDILGQLRLVSSVGHNWTIVDVGANKGYTIVAILAALGVDLNVTASASHLFASLIAHARLRRNARNALSVLCGACGDCRDVHGPHAGDVVSAGSVKVIGVEANPGNAHFLRDYFNGAIHGANVTIITGAVSNASGNATFCTNFRSLGDELGHLVSGDTPCKSYSKHRMPIVTHTLDDLLLPVLNPREGELATSVIDFLLTDTEGFDYIVAQGAKQLLSRQLVRLYLFEMWGSGLGNHTAWVYSLGYTCFFPLQIRDSRSKTKRRNPFVTAALKSTRKRRRYMEFSGNCWSDDYNWLVGFYNALCVSNKEKEMIQHFRSMSYLM
jgi:hypothetical protein